MALFISILEGPSASRATPIMAISDPVLVELLGKRISERMVEKTPDHPLEDECNPRPSTKEA